MGTRSGGSRSREPGERHGLCVHCSWEESTIPKAEISILDPLIRSRVSARGERFDLACVVAFAQAGDCVRVGWPVEGEDFRELVEVAVVPCG